MFSCPHPAEAEAIRVVPVILLRFRMVLWFSWKKIYVKWLQKSPHNTLSKCMVNILNWNDLLNLEVCSLVFVRIRIPNFFSVLITRYITWTMHMVRVLLLFIVVTCLLIVTTRILRIPFYGPGEIIYIIISKNIRYLLWNRGAWRLLKNTYTLFLTPCIRCTNH